MLNPEEVLALDEWRLRERMPGRSTARSTAVRGFLRRGLAAEGYLTDDHRGQKSGAFGVIDGESPN